jgi:hypothetical protein
MAMPHTKDGAANACIDNQGDQAPATDGANKAARFVAGRLSKNA